MDCQEWVQTVQASLQCSAAACFSLDAGIILGVTDCSPELRDAMSAVACAARHLLSGPQDWFRGPEQAQQHAECWLVSGERVFLCRWLSASVGLVLVCRVGDNLAQLSLVAEQLSGVPAAAAAEGHGGRPA